MLNSKKMLEIKFDSMRAKAKEKFEEIKAFAEDYTESDLSCSLCMLRLIREFVEEYMANAELEYEFCAIDKDEYYNKYMAYNYMKKTLENAKIIGRVEMDHYSK